MRLSILFFVLLCFICNYPASTCAQEKKAVDRKPNLLFIITDQYRYDALSIAGNKILNTPNLDRLAKQGVHFKNAYTPMAVCAPARASILTGRIVEHTGVVTNAIVETATENSGVMPQKTFDEILASNGYRVEYYGKYHSPEFHNKVYQNPEKLTSKGLSVFGHGMRQHYVDYLAKNVPQEKIKEGDFRDDYSGRGYTPNPLDKRLNDNGLSKGKYSQPDYHGRLNIPADYSITAMHAKETIDAIERLKNKPFSITCSFHYPHAPMLPTAKYYQMYSPDKMIAPASIKDDMSNSPYKAANGRLANPEYSDPDKLKYMMSDYYGLVKEIDDWMGKIMDKLDKTGLADNTLIIFTSDHGEMLGAHGLREKNVFYEESAHIPLLMRFPKGIKAGTTVSNYVTNVDLFATIFDYLGYEGTQSDGLSLRDVIENKKSTRPDYVVTEWNYRGDAEPNYMIIKNGWKMFIPQTETSRVIDVLFDLNKDPFEMNNLLGSNKEKLKYSAKVEELKRDLVEWLKKNNSNFVSGVSNRKII